MKSAPRPDLHFRHKLKWLPQRESLRTQLIAWNIVVLALLLGGMGLVIRGAVSAAMLSSIDRDLEERLGHFRPPPPPSPPYRDRPANHPPDQSLNPAANPRFRPSDSDSQPPLRLQQEPPPEERGPNPLRYPGDNAPPRPQPGEDPQPPDPQQADLPPNNTTSIELPYASFVPEQREPQPARNTDPYRPLPLDLQGKVMGLQDTRHLWDAKAFAQAAKGETVHSTVFTGDQPLRVLSRRFPLDGKIAGVIQTAYPLNDVYRALRGLDRALLMLIPFALLCAGLGGAYLTGRVLRRVRSMTQAAEQIGAQEFAHRLPIAGNDEFAGLAITFNGLLGRLEGAYKQQEHLLEQQRRFTADASHELKTPLTIIKGHTSLTLSGAVDEGADANSPYRQSLQEIDRAADTMSHLVQDLLLLARSDGGQLGRQRIRLLLREILERALSGVPRAGAKVTLTIKESGNQSGNNAAQTNAMLNAVKGAWEDKADDTALCVKGNETELIRLFANLLENAVRYTPESGSVQVTAWREDGRVLVTIADTGIGIAPEHLPHLGERFYRIDTSRTRPTGGTGLGLSICKGIVEAHAGTLAFASAVGSGTTVTVTLPAA